MTADKPEGVVFTRARGLRGWRLNRKWARWDARRDKAIRETATNPPFPLFGLPPSWNGIRRPAGVSQNVKSREVSALGLSHSPSADSARSLTVTSMLHDMGMDEEDIEIEMGVRNGDGDLIASEPDWIDVQISVDGQAKTFKMLRGPEGRWGATTAIDGNSVALMAEDFPVEDVELVRLENALDYLPD